MKVLFFAFVIYAVLQFGYAKSAKEPVLAELRSHVLAKNFLLRRAVVIYRNQGYHTMANFVREAQLSDNALNHLDKLPTNLPVEKLDGISRKIFNSMQSFSFYFPLYNNASHLSNSLKAGALSVALREMKQGNETLYSNYRTYNELPMTSKYIIDKVAETIRLEENVLVDGKLERSSLELEKLYAILKEIVPWNSWFTKMETIKLIHDNCDAANPDCNDELKKALAEYDAYDQQVKEYLPIDSKFSVDEWLNILDKRQTLYYRTMNIISDTDYYIISIDGCQQESEDN